MEKQIRIFDPTITPKEQALRYAPRPASLQGKKVGLVENTKYNSDTLLLKIGKILQDEYGVQGMRHPGRVRCGHCRGGRLRLLQLGQCARWHCV